MTKITKLMMNIGKNQAGEETGNLEKYRNSRPGTFCKKVLLKISQIHRKVSFLIKLQAYNFIKRYTLVRCFPVNFPKFLRTLFCIEPLLWLLLNFINSSFYNQMEIPSLILRNCRPGIFCKKVFLKISQNSLENTCAKLRPLRATLRDSDTGVFLQFLRIFLRTPFLIRYLL